MFRTPLYQQHAHAPTRWLRGCLDPSHACFGIALFKTQMLQTDLKSSGIARDRPEPLRHPGD